MNKFLRKHRTFVFVFLAIIMVSLPFFGLGTNYLFSSPQDTVLKINGQKIKRGEYDRLLNQIVQSQPELTPEQKQQIRGQALNELIRLVVYDQEAKKYGLYVSDQELKLQLENTPQFQKDGRFDPATYVQTLTRLANTTPEEFEKFRKRDMAALKLNQLIASSIRISDADFKDTLQARMAIETDVKKKKEWQKDPESLRNELRNQEVNWAFQDWLGSINSTLKVKITSAQFRESLERPTQQPGR
jgi:parvulin-like peptidyl-prolyl isomerase